MVQQALREGRLTRLPCQECGIEPAQGHHHNGYEPGHELDLVWLCPKHHSAAHRAMKEE
jgi:rubredoxin